jgi:hypothetical protein
MTDKMRWRYGDTNPVIAAVDAETVIEIGDLLWLDGDDAKPSSLINGDAQFDLPHEQRAEIIVRMQYEFADRFLGVAMQRSRSGEADPLRVATTGVFELDCPSGTFELGDLVAAKENAGGTALLNQQEGKAAAAKYAIGRIAKRESSDCTSVLVDIRSTVMTGGVKGSVSE